MRGLRDLTTHPSPTTSLKRDRAVLTLLSMELTFMKISLIRTVASAAFIVALVSACTTNPVTGRKEYTAGVSPQEELQLGITSFDKMKQEVPISRDPALNAAVQRVGQRIANVATKDMPNAQWEFVVFDSDEANAFCLPGGKVGVYKGIFAITKNDAGLATVVAHEVAHAVSRHGAERMATSQALQVGGQLVGAATQSAKPITQTAVAAAYGLGGQVGYQLPHSRSQESEADHIGLIYMARAGFQPREAVSFWQRFAAYNEQRGGSKTSSLLSDHPVDSKRIEQIQGWLPEAQQQYVGGGLKEPAGAARGSDIISR
jgi:predicted Zn-dependent protease